MVKNRKREVALIDEQGQEWVRAILSPACVRRIIKEFARYSIQLEEVII